MPHKLLPADPAEVERCGKQLDTAIASPTAVALIKEFYDPTTRYAGHSFLEGAFPEDNRITHRDLLAITALQVHFEPRPVRLLQDTTSDRRRAAIRSLELVDRGLDICDADDDALQRAYNFELSVLRLVEGRQAVAVQSFAPESDHA